MPECAKCGKEFDSERGLKVHNAQVHGDEAEVVETKKEAEAGNITFRLNYRHALLIAFAVGILTGGFFSLMALQLGGATGFLVADSPSDNDGNNAPSQPNDPSDGTVDMSDISLEGEPVLGEPDAPVTIVLFEDYECPFCQRFEQGAAQQIKDNYVDSGDVKIVWKDFPLAQIHPWATPAAAAMECVYREDNDAFWTVKDKIFVNQQTIDSPDDATTKIIEWAVEEGVSESAVQSCLENDNPTDEVNSDLQDGRSLDVTGTPTIFVNGKKIVGAQPYSVFQQEIEAALNE